LIASGAFLREKLLGLPTFDFDTRDARDAV
jgi:hypothetical protein